MMKEKSMSKRPETGAMRFGDDWTGVFIRGDEAMFFSMAIEKLAKTGVMDVDYYAEAALISLKEVLQSSRHIPGIGEPEAQVMKDFEKCLSVIPPDLDQEEVVVVEFISPEIAEEQERQHVRDMSDDELIDLYRARNAIHSEAIVDEIKKELVCRNVPIRTSEENA